LLSELAGAGAKTRQRKARFRCVIALARAGKLLDTFNGAVEGTIVDRPRGSHGFGYDPIFVPNGFEQTFAEFPAEVKNRISHRAKAIRALAAKFAALKPSD
jgi:XTP/dITP diphosphohydrolase